MLTQSDNDDQFPAFSAVCFIHQPAMTARTNIILPKQQVLRSNLELVASSLPQMGSNYGKSKNCLIVVYCSITLT